jgi:hypothetical protein
MQLAELAASTEQSQAMDFNAFCQLEVAVCKARPRRRPQAEPLLPMDEV